MGATSFFVPGRERIQGKSHQERKIVQEHLPFFRVASKSALKNDLDCRFANKQNEQFQYGSLEDCRFSTSVSNRALRFYQWYIQRCDPAESETCRIELRSSALSINIFPHVFLAQGSPRLPPRIQATSTARLCFVGVFYHTAFESLSFTRLRYRSRLGSRPHAAWCPSSNSSWVHLLLLQCPHHAPEAV